jgi:hypothetical protein
MKETIKLIYSYFIPVFIVKDRVSKQAMECCNFEIVMSKKVKNKYYICFRFGIQN